MRLLSSLFVNGTLNAMLNEFAKQKRSLKSPLARTKHCIRPAANYLFTNKIISLFVFKITQLVVFFP